MPFWGPQDDSDDYRKSYIAYLIARAVAGNRNASALLRGLGGYEEALRAFDEGMKIFNSAETVVNPETVMNPALKAAAYSKAYDVLTRAEKEALSIHRMDLVSAIRSLKDKAAKSKAAQISKMSLLDAAAAGGSMASKIRASRRKTMKSASDLDEVVQREILDDLIEAFSQLRTRFTHDRNIATMKDARTMLKMETFTNKIREAELNEGRKLSQKEKGEIFRSMVAPSRDELDRFRFEASIRKMDAMTNTINEAIRDLEKSNPDLAQHYRDIVTAVTQR